MEFSITIQDKNEIPLLRESPTLYGTSHAKNTDSVVADTTFGNITSQRTEGNGFTIWASDYFFKEHNVLNVVSAKPVLFFHLILRNSIRIGIDNLEYVMAEGQFNFSSFPQFKILAKTHKTTHLKTFHVHFEPGYLHKYLNGSEPLAVFLRDINRAKQSRLSSRHHFASMEMMAAVLRILGNPYEGRIGRLFTDSQVNVLILEGLYKIREDLKIPRLSALSRKDKEKIILAREHLMSHLEESISIQHLAREVHINESTLKKGFRQLFGNTISKYHTNLRLEEAMRCLIETNMSVEEVVYSLGFTHPTYFTQAFKKKFGLTPSHVKKFKESRP